VRVALDGHEVRHPHRPRHGDPANVVAAEIDEHDVLRPLLLVGEQVSLVGAVFLRRHPTGSGPGDGVVGQRPPFETDEELGRGADDLVVPEIEVEHVG
jgi:hypothetical protein